MFGRGQLETRGAYLSVLSFIALVVAAIGLVVALNGVVDVVVPGQVRQAGELDRGIDGGRRFGFGGGFQGFSNAVPNRPGPGGTRDPGVTRRPLPDRSSATAQPRLHATRDVRSRGWVRLLRGLTLALVAGAIYIYHWRLVRPERQSVPSAPPEPAAA